MNIEAKKRKDFVRVSNEQIKVFISNNPGVTASAIISHFGFSESSLFRKLEQLINKKEVYFDSMNTDSRPIRKYFTTETTSSIKEEVKETMTEIKEAPQLGTVSIFPIKNTRPSLDTLITEAAHNIAQRMLEQIKQELMMGLEDLVLEVAPKITRDGFLNKAPKEKVTKPKVLITGLLSHQAGIISSEFYEFFDLDFWNDRTGNSTEQLKSMAKRADVILYHKNHASHNHQEIIKSVGGNIKIINGGISSMKDALTDLYVNGVK